MTASETSTDLKIAAALKVDQMCAKQLNAAKESPAGILIWNDRAMSRGED